jgi:hypothetical protein
LEDSPFIFLLKNEIKKCIFATFNNKKILGSKYLLSFWKNSHESFLITLKQDLGGKLMLFVSLPEQFSPNRPSEHWQCPSVPQVP